MKKMKFLLVIIAMFMIVGCGEKKSGTEAVSSSKNEEKGYPVTVTDHAGRNVTIEKEPETIVSGYYISTSMLIALGQDDKLLGVENNAEKRPIYALSSPGLLDLPGMGTVKDFDLETCAVLNPDLVILPYKLKDMVSSLEQLDIPVLIVMPESQELLKETINMLGTATGSSHKAEELITFMDDKLSELQTAVGDEEKPRVYLSGNSNFLTTASPQMYQNNLIINAGGENVAKELEDTYWAEVSYEQILAWDPEYIILAADAQFTVETILADPNLAECTAVVNKNVYQIPAHVECLDAPVPGSVLGNLWLASVLHPDQYPVSEYEEVFTEYYEAFYQFTPEI